MIPTREVRVLISIRGNCRLVPRNGPVAVSQTATAPLQDTESVLATASAWGESRDELPLLVAVPGGASAEPVVSDRLLVGTIAGVGAQQQRKQSCESQKGPGCRHLSLRKGLGCRRSLRFVDDQKHWPQVNGDCLSGLQNAFAALVQLEDIHAAIAVLDLSSILVHGFHTSWLQTGPSTSHGSKRAGSNLQQRNRQLLHAESVHPSAGEKQHKQFIPGFDCWDPRAETSGSVSISPNLPAPKSSGSSIRAFHDRDKAVGTAGRCQC